MHLDFNVHLNAHIRMNIKMKQKAMWYKLFCFSGINKWILREFFFHWTDLEQYKYCFLVIFCRNFLYSYFLNRVCFERCEENFRINWICVLKLEIFYNWKFKFRFGHIICAYFLLKLSNVTDYNADFDRKDIHLKF